jgi:hypothetical protein
MGRIRMGDMKNAHKFWSENPKGRDHSKELGLDGKTILEWILGKRVGSCGLDSSGL